MKKREEYWFAECDPVSNENLMRELDALGLGEEVKQRNRMCTDGKKRELISLPNELVAELKKAKRIDVDKKLHQFRFFVSSTPNGKPHSGSFIEQKYIPKSVQEAQKQIKALKAEKAARGHPR